MINYQCSFCPVCYSDDQICDCKKNMDKQLLLIQEIFGCTLTEVDELPVRKMTNETSTNEKQNERSKSILENSIKSSQTQLQFSGT